MGIDPVTHEPLHKHAATTTATQVTSSITSADRHPDSSKKTLRLPSPENNGRLTTPDQENSSSAAENCSGDESRLSDNNGGQGSLMSCLLWGDDKPLVEASWKFPTTSAGETYNDVGSLSWEENCAWLLDYQDFGVEEFGFGCFNDIAMDMSTLEMGDKP
nr:TPA_asm: hypothetical protein HUJ06_020064 [Nelumbo nucifera]